MIGLDEVLFLSFIDPHPEKNTLRFSLEETMGSLALHLLTILLGVIFIVLGNIKVTPQFFPEYHNHVKNEFGKWNKEFPLYQLTGWRPYAKNYRIAVGVIEISAGTLLVLAGCKSNTHFKLQFDHKNIL